MNCSPGEWYEEDTESEFPQHELVAVVLFSEYSRKRDEYEKDSIDEVGDIRYRDPELVENSADIEEVSTRPVGRHEPSDEHNCRRYDDCECLKK